MLPNKSSTLKPIIRGSSVNSSNLQLIIELSHVDISEEELDKSIRLLKSDLEEIDEVESVSRETNSNVPEGSKSAGDALLNILKAEVTPVSCMRLLKFLSDRLGNKPLKLKVRKPDGREIELEASSREEFEYLRQQAQEFLTGA
jgi:hypothetical protein